MALPVTTILPDVETLTERILACYAQSTAEEIDNGGAWYPLAHLYALRLAKGNVRKGAGVIAALSPQTSWNENVKLANRAFHSGASGHTPSNVEKARAILRGETPEDVLGGRKVCAFYALICAPYDAFYVVIDRHALAIAIGPELEGILDFAYAPSNNATKILARVGAYDLIADAYRKAAATLGILPSAVQATTWLTHRRLKRANVSTFSTFEAPAAFDDSADREAFPNDYF